MIIHFIIFEKYTCISTHSFITRMQTYETRVLFSKHAHVFQRMLFPVLGKLLSKSNSITNYILHL
jgi:hypothetical protein